VAKLYRNSFDDLRKKELKRLKSELSDIEYKKLKNVMWILRKNITDQTEEDLAKLKLLFKYSPILETAYLLRNTLTDIFEMHITKSSAKNKIKLWIRKVRKSGLKCFDKFISTLEKLLDEILNYFIHRHNSGFVEGLNNKVKVLKRRCYGILNRENLFKRLHLDLQGYRIFSL
jgi:transposase